MSGGRMVEWFFLVLTIVLMVLLKWLHYGVTHYNIFLLILLGWSLVLIWAFRLLVKNGASSEGGDSHTEPSEQA